MNTVNHPLIDTVDGAARLSATLPANAVAPLTLCDTRAEAIRDLRTDLIARRKREESGPVLAILSPAGGEGRSSLAADLAVSFAQLRQRTLLIDADLRKPKQHELFGTQACGGLVQAIESFSASADHMQSVRNLPHLSLLTVGAQPSDPLEMISDGRFETLLESLRGRYEHIVIDTPPALGASDALAVADLAGHALLLNRAHRTPYKANRELLRRVSATRARIVGAIITRF